MTAREEARIRAARIALTDQKKLVATLRIRLATAEARLPDMERELDVALATPRFTTDLAELCWNIGTAGMRGW